MKNKKKKVYHKVVRFAGGKKNNRVTFLEFGWIESPTFHNDIYIMINSAHKGGDSASELRTDEALLYIQGLAAVVRRKLTGVVLTLEEVEK